MKLKRKIIKRVHQFKVRKYEKIDGFLSPNEAVGLYRTACRLGLNSKVVEIGSWKGKSTYCIAKGLKSGKVIAIDPFDASGDEASEVTYNNKKGEDSLLDQFTFKMHEFGVLDQIEIRQGYSKDFVGTISEIDFLFIDADHSIRGCNFDFMNYSSSVKVGGYIAFHDYYPSRKDLGPTWVIENKVLPSKKYEVDKLYDSLWIGRKIA